MDNLSVLTTVAKVAILSPWLVLIPFFLFRYRPDQSGKFILILAITGFLIDAVGYGLYMYQRNNLFLFYVLNICDLLILSLYFYHLLSAGSARNLLPLFTVSGIIVILAEAFFLSGLFTTSYRGRLYVCLFSILYSMVFFYQLIMEMRTEKLSSYSHFWFNIAILFRYAAILFVSLPTDILFDEEMPKQGNGLWLINNVATMIFYILVLIGVSRWPRKYSTLS